MSKKLTAKQQRFADEYLIDLNATAAYKRAGYAGKGHVAESSAAEILSNPEVSAYIAAKKKSIQEKTGINAERVLQELWGIATADANELVEFRRSCCRYCHGDGFKYQRTANEMVSDREQHQQAVKEAKLDPKKPPVKKFDPRGGIGYDSRKSPHTDCPECFGEGVEKPFFKDTRKLSPAARSLYAGVKVTKEGIQVALQDKGAALEKLMRHLGMFEKDNKQKTDPVTELLALLHSRNTKLPIKS